MAVRLTIVDDGDTASEYVRSFVQDRIVIGRSRSADICLPDMAVSTRHAEIRLHGTDYVLMDLESLNGSYVNEKPVLSFQKRTLHSDDTIQIAGFSIRVTLGVGPGPDEPRDMSVRQAREILTRLSARSGVAADVLCVSVTAGPCRGARLTLSPGSAAVVGRGTDSTLVLDDRDVSRSHVEITAGDGCITVRDLGSKNGIVQDGTRLERLTVSYGESFILGKSTLLLEHPAEATLGAIFEAPEEETSSFSPTFRAGARRADGRIAADTASYNAEPATISGRMHPPHPATAAVDAAAREFGTTDAAPEPVPVGPADPLEGAPEPQPERTADRPGATASKTEEGSDLGLIIIGILLLAAATGGLAYLFH